jgi:hypothetical protein
MAIAQFQRIGTETFQDDEVTATPEEIADTLAVTVYGFEVDNSQNTEDVFFKMWNRTEAPSVGTDVPDHVFRVLSGEKLGIIFDADGSGHAFAVGCWIACVTQGGTAGTVSPTNPVPLTMSTNTPA